MAKQAEPAGINSWLEDELYYQYRHDRTGVDEAWKRVFEANGHAAAEAARPVPAGGVKQPPSAGIAARAALPAAPGPAHAAAPEPEQQVQPLRGAYARIAENMNASLGVPVATSQRTIPVKVADENRAIINQHRVLTGRPKVSYTHLIGWAVVRALEAFPNLNSGYLEMEGQPYRIARRQLNLGIAIDVAGRDGTRMLTVPNIKDAGSLDFQAFMAAFDDIVDRARRGKLVPEDFQGTTVSLTNPGTVGTVASVPRLMAGQGAIIATGAIDYPAGYQGASDETRAALGLSKVMTITCTYDHRIIQGAESGLFLGRVQALLQGEHDFYTGIFRDLKVPYRPVRWEPDRGGVAAGGGERERASGIAKQAAVLQLINAYRVRGHLIADLDPLGREPGYHPELDPATWGLTIWDLDREFLTGNLGGAEGGEVATLRRTLETLRRTYCGRLTCEYMNIQAPEQKRWLQQRMEPAENSWPLEPAARKRVLQRLIEAEEFEHFLHSKWVGHKRFGLEGGESAIAILDEVMHRAAASGASEIVMGMAHRGRLNVLANLLAKPLQQIFSYFEEADPESIQGSGDVKYHVGTSGVRTLEDGSTLAVSLSPNPSHLEAVDPVVEGIVRPKQDRIGDTRRERVIPVLVHGDAAFAGQGVVAETLNLSQLEGYRTGGTIHLVINNQIGFTTSPAEARSTLYSTDVARMVQAPVFHVNGDDAEACARAAQLAFDYRREFGKDVVIDMVCYRRHGHNEADDPSYTQPVMYRKIREHPSVTTLYAEQLVREGVLAEEDVAAMRSAYQARLAEAFAAAQQHAETYVVREVSPVTAEEAGAIRPYTAVERRVLAAVVGALSRFPDDFHLHPKLRNFVERRRQAFEAGGPVDWAFAEALAFGSLVVEGTHVRLSGQDSSRGTFSQRHAVFSDYEDGHEYCPLQHIAPDQARFEVYDSLLSEYAVLGFEFGYSLGDPLALVIWEAQFGDFANGAQIMIDQFLVGSEAKWGQPSGLVLLLPHGLEGQGPEHSSARVERFLQLAAGENIQVVNPSTPAQYFHVLRRQMHGGRDRRGVRKPLIVLTPKSLLRHPRAVSQVDELAGGSFREVVGETAPQAPDSVRRLVLCSGKLYYELAAAREQKKAQGVAIARVEQLYPFPGAQVQGIIARYPETAEVAWVQEEPWNMGPWRFVREQIQPLIAESRRVLRYIGRPESSSPATGLHRRHVQEQNAIIEAALAFG